MGRNLDSACIAYEYVFGAAFVYVVAVVFVLSSIGMLLYTTETCALMEGFLLVDTQKFTLWLFGFKWRRGFAKVCPSEACVGGECFFFSVCE